MNHGGTPPASNAPIIDPALVPRMTSAVAGSHPVPSVTAASAPASQAPPRTPPAPSTRPTRGRSREVMAAVSPAQSALVGEGATDPPVGAGAISATSASRSRAAGSPHSGG
jgi:hypothetical protein